MTDHDVVRRLHAVTGLGTVGNEYRTAAQYKPQIRWVVAKQSEVLQLLYTVWPLLGERKQGAATAAINHVLASPGQGWRRARSAA